MKKPLRYAGAVLGGGFAAVYAGLYYRAMHPKCPKPNKSRKRIACVGDSITYRIQPLSIIVVDKQYEDKILSIKQ